MGKEIIQIKSRSELYKLLPKDFVSIELGVAEGLFSRDILAMGSALHYMIDSYKTLHQPGDAGNNQEWHNKNFRNAYAITESFGEKRQIIKALTTFAATDFPNEVADLIYVDADHSYGGCIADIQAFWPKLKPGGIMAFHDYDNERDYGVKQAVTEFAKENNLQVNYIPENGYFDAGAWVRKPLK
jgi:hypothetical protein